MAKRQLSIKSTTTKGIVIVTPKGAIDASNEGEFEKAIESAFSSKHPRLLLDCSGLTYVNSAIFSLLVKYHRKCNALSGGLVLSGLTSKVRNIIQLLELDKLLDIQPDRKSAMKRFEAE